MARVAIAERFSRYSRAAPRTYRAPGRVNLIGEHTDYNDGLVLPAAIDLFTWLAIAPRERRLIVHSEILRETVEIDPAAALSPQGDWRDYVAGVVVMLRRAGHDVPGATIVIDSAIPLGAGLSSSAALEVAVATALLELLDVRMEPLDIARLCQRAENEFVGARCGLMDQFAVTHGVADHALLFDCRSLEHRVVPLAAGVRLVICNTMVRHSHASGGYNVRRAECDEILARLQARDPSIGTLRDISVEELDRVSADLPDLLRRRLRHVVSENERVALTAAALAGGDLDTVGRQLAASHDSLRDDYEVSTPELDLMVELARGKPGVTGARMTGGGFGGCTINLVGEADAEGFASEIRGEFGARTGVRPQIFICSAADGVRRVDS